MPGRDRSRLHREHDHEIDRHEQHEHHDHDDFHERPGHGHGPDGATGPHGRRPGRRRSRVARGDVRLAVLQLLAEEPMHGYQLMQAIADRSGGRWSPSPGAIYPTISQLEDEGLVTVSADAGRRLVALTDTGRRLVAEQRESRPDPFADYAGPGPGNDLRRILQQLHAAARSVAVGGSEQQRTAAATVLKDARRALYLILAEGDEAEGDEAEGDGAEGDGAEAEPSEPDQT